MSVDAILHDSRCSEDGCIQLTVSLGSQPSRSFHATYDASDPRCVVCTLEHELFMALSNLAFRRFGNCIVYQHELIQLIGAFCTAADSLPSLPVTLGTTNFCTLKPSRGCIAWNKFWILLRRLGLYRPRDYVAGDGQAR